MTRFYLSNNATLGIGDLELGSRSVDPLAVGDTSSGSTFVTIPTGIAAGMYYLFAKTDADKEVPELFEGNNTAFQTLKISPDLAVSLLSAPAGAGVGATILVSDTTVNQGDSTAGASTTSFYLSADKNFSSKDRYLGSRAIPLLGPGQTHAGSTAIVIPPNTAAGDYQLFAVADGDNAISETNEANNALRKSIKITRPDLTISALTAPGSAQAGSTVSVTDSTKNAGLAGAPGTTTGFYLKKSGTADLFVGSRAVPELAPGQTSTAASSVTIPPGTPAGTYSLMAVADSGGNVFESSETNNRKSLSVTVSQ
jgi:subtilase family serine protease